MARTSVDERAVVVRPELFILRTNYDWSPRAAEYDAQYILRAQRALNGNRGNVLPSYDILGDPVDYEQHGGRQLEARLREYRRTVGQDFLYPCIELRPEKIVVHARLGREWRLPLPTSDGDRAYQLLCGAIRLEGDEFAEARAMMNVTHLGLLVDFVSNDRASHDRAAQNPHLARLVDRLNGDFAVRYLEIMRREFESYSLPPTGTQG